jgi:hypothetical protein
MAHDDSSRAPVIRRRPGLVSLLSGALVLGGLAGLVAPVLPAQAATSSCDDDSNLCLAPHKGAKWDPGRSSTPRERSKRTKKNSGTLSVTIEGGRGSVFVNGRYVGTAPFTGIEIPRGRNDLQVRDGADVIASGVLQVPNNADLEVTVRHP